MSELSSILGFIDNETSIRGPFLLHLVIRFDSTEPVDVFAVFAFRGGMGRMQKQQKFDFEKIHWKYRFSHGGMLRNSRKGRGIRPLSRKEALHLVFKVNKDCLRGGLRTYRRYFLIQKIVDRYAQKFFVKIEQISIQNDHVHFLIRASRRTDYQSFFRVVAGQIAQQFQKNGLLNFALDLNQKKKVTDTKVKSSSITSTPKKSKKLWKYRPFTRVIRGWKAYRTAVSYVRLNEQEALGNIPYRKLRLTGLSAGEWEILWA